MLAELLGYPGLFAHLQAALALQEQEPAQALTSVQLVRAAVRALIRQGYREKVTLKQLGLEMQRSMPEQTSPKMAAWLEPRWVGRTLRTEQLVDPDAKDERRWLWGEQTRLVTLAPGFVAQTLDEFDTQDVGYTRLVRQPLEFCLPRRCNECPYAGDCTMRPRKEKQ